MAIPILKAPIEVGNRLHELGTSTELLLAVVDAVVDARAECTDNDPSGARGWRGWQMGTRRNREIHCSAPDSDWKQDETDQIASIVNEKIGIRIIVCNTDDGTCVEFGRPRNRSKKGVGHDRLVDETQLSFVYTAPPSEKVVRLHVRLSGEKVRTYYLCVYHEGDERRAELSCAVEMSSGYFSDFKERIFIIGGEAGTTDPVKRRDDGDDSSEFDIPVIKKK